MKFWCNRHILLYERNMKGRKDRRVRKRVSKGCGQARPLGEHSFASDLSQTQWKWRSVAQVLSPNLIKLVTDRTVTDRWRNCATTRSGSRSFQVVFIVWAKVISFQALSCQIWEIKIRMSVFWQAAVSGVLLRWKAHSDPLAKWKRVIMSERLHPKIYLNSSSYYQQNILKMSK